MTCFLLRTGASWGLGSVSPSDQGFLREKAVSLPSDWEILEGADGLRHWDV